MGEKVGQREKHRESGVVGSLVSLLFRWLACLSFVCSPRFKSFCGLWAGGDAWPATCFPPNGQNYQQGETTNDQEDPLAMYFRLTAAVQTIDARPPYGDRPSSQGPLFVHLVGLSVYAAPVSARPARFYGLRASRFSRGPVVSAAVHVRVLFRWHS